MTDQPRPFSEDDLIAYTGGTAPEPLRQRIEAAMANDQDFRAEIAVMRALKTALSSDTGVNHAREFGWRKLEAEIRRDSRAPQSPKARSATSLWRAAAIVFGIAVIGQTGYLAYLTGGTPEAGYRTASDPFDAFVLAIAVADNAKADATLDLLLRAKGRVIDGPGSLGLYRVAFASETALAEGRTLFQASELIELVADE